MNLRTYVIAGAILMLGAMTAHAAATAPSSNETAKEVAVRLCSACHGPGGHSISPTFPILAGQQEVYIAEQLRAFKNKTRADPEAHNYMWGMAATIPDSLIDSLAHYFASQPPPKGVPGNPKLVAEGEKLFKHGNAPEHIPPCETCHGPHALGNGIFPRLAGQHAAYIVRQLTVIQENLRASPVMHGIVTQLTPDQMKAVAAYLQSL